MLESREPDSPSGCTAIRKPGNRPRPRSGDISRGLLCITMCARLLARVHQVLAGKKNPSRESPGANCSSLRGKAEFRIMSCSFIWDHYSEPTGDCTAVFTLQEFLNGVKQVGDLACKERASQPDCLISAVTQIESPETLNFYADAFYQCSDAALLVSSKCVSDNQWSARASQKPLFPPQRSHCQRLPDGSTSPVH